MRQFKILVKTLALVLINEIGRQLRKTERPPFLGSKETDVPYQDWGKIPELNPSL
ncbi:hypothetical protein BCV71DRAFT_188754 [Rhizopus microsporus]|uniref:Uncharacterized protein n=1 Tax=Rhizopus microsporus TaxID=58291 RepID=A0A1X0RNY5_RHIZD|nr:hypothetical protein BCV71DRAFT_188754 [Rhizopus microsporus]